MKSGLTTRRYATVACAFLLVLGSSSFTYARSLEKSFNQVNKNSSYTNILRHNYTEAEIADLKEFFNIFDKDGDAKLDSHEIWIALRTLGKDKTLGQIGQLYLKYDADGNGSFDFPEFLEMMWWGALLD